MKPLPSFSVNYYLNEGLMKQILILPLIVLFSISSSYGTDFPIHKYEKWIAKGKYVKAQKKIEELLLIEPEVYSEDYAKLWLYRGNCYSLSYFDDVHDVKTFDDKSYLLINRYIEEALYSFKKSYKFGDAKIRQKVVAQMTQLQRFFKTVANRYQRLGNYNRFYINSRRARTCNLFLVHKSRTSQLDQSLIFMLADAAELAGHPDEALFLRNELIQSGIGDAELFSKTVQLYLDRNDEVRALGTLDIGMKLHPKSKEIFDQKLNLLKQLEMEKEATAFLKINIKKFPSYKSELNFLKGLELEKKYEMDVDSEELFASIEKNYRKAVRTSPENEEYIKALANLYYKKALRIKSAAVDNKTTEKEYVQLLGKARKTISKALKLGQGDKASLTNALQFVNSENASMLE